MGARKKKVVPQVVEVRNAALRARRIKNRNWNIDGANARPCQPDDNLRIEIKTAGRADRVENFTGWLDGIDSKSKQRVSYAFPEGVEPGEPVSHFASVDAFPGSFRSENRGAKNHGVGVFPGEIKERGDGGGGVLAVGIHDQNPSQAASGGFVERGQDAGTFALVCRVSEDFPALPGGEFGFELLVAFIGRGVNDNPDRVVLLESGANGAQQLVTAIVGGEDNRSGCNGFHAGNPPEGRAWWK